MIEKRIPKDNDQEFSLDACDRLKYFISQNLDIEGTIWISAYLALVAEVLHKNNVPYDYYCQLMNDARDHYKGMWEEYETK